MHYLILLKKKNWFSPLISDMVRNKGFIPSAPGEISIQRKQIKAIIESLLPACTEPDIKSGEPFRAQAIIANPPAYGESITVTLFLLSSCIFSFLIKIIYQLQVLSMVPHEFFFK